MISSVGPFFLSAWLQSASCLSCSVLDLTFGETAGSIAKAIRIRWCSTKDSLYAVLLCGAYSDPAVPMLIAGGAATISSRAGLLSPSKELRKASTSACLSSSSFFSSALVCCAES